MSATSMLLRLLADVDLLCSLHVVVLPFAGSFVLRAVCGCTKVASSSGEPSNPCLFADREHLASSSIGRNWGLVLSKARDAEAGRRRAPNGTQQPWNINFGTNSPMLLQQQGAPAAGSGP